MTAAANDWMDPSVIQVSDATVIEESRADPERFAEIYDRHADVIHAYLARRVGTIVADDLSSDTFLVAFRLRGRYDVDRPDARPWLYGIATNLLRRHFRTAERERRANLRVLADGAGESPDDILGRLEAEQLGPQLAAALSALPAGDRDALLLLAWARLNYEQIALALDVPVGTVRSRIHRARLRVRAHLSEGEAR